MHVNSTTFGGCFNYLPLVGTPEGRQEGEDCFCAENAYCCLFVFFFENLEIEIFRTLPELFQQRKTTTFREFITVVLRISIQFRTLKLITMNAELLLSM